MPALRALKVKCASWPGAVKVDAAPPPGPVTPCRSMLCGILLDGWFFRWNSTVSPWRTRMKLPGTVPPNVQNVYDTPSEIGIVFSITSSSTITLAGVLRVIGGGTFGGLVSTALMGAPWGGPRVPASRAGAGAGAAVAAAALPRHSMTPTSIEAAMAGGRMRDFTVRSLQSIEDSFRMH